MLNIYVAFTENGYMSMCPIQNKNRLLEHGIFLCNASEGVCVEEDAAMSVCVGQYVIHIYDDSVNGLSIRHVCWLIYINV